MKHRELVAYEGWIFVGMTGALAAVSFWQSLLITAAILSMLTFFCVYFFRNPERSVADTDGISVSPADGKVMDITLVEEPLFIQGEAIRVRIFLSLFNVHINRTPMAGEIIWVQQVSGKFLPAFKDEAGLKNQRNYVGMETDEGKVLVVQVTGLVARRLICWVKVGQVVVRGERFGLIRFGSCTELYLPVHSDVVVKSGDRVRGGESIIAKFNSR